EEKWLWIIVADVFLTLKYIFMTQYEAEMYPYQEETYKIIGIAMEIHRELGKGFSEIVYKDAYEYEFKQNGIFYEREKEYAVNYKGTILPHKFYADFVVFDKIILEVKSKKGIVEDHYAQVMNYLAISKLEIGLLINFHEKSLEYKRIIMSH
ncbi:MAG TPA: GxxExxY protein, partial [Ferruginibacter sp.]|nr:GxxExxY protein [Ferruginibacter sp.]